MSRRYSAATLLLALLLALLPSLARAGQSTVRPAQHDRHSLLSCSMPNAWYCQVLLRKKGLRPSPPVPLNSLF
ncbi:MULTISPECIES: hypothetical protein [unclassified Paludibacterium]|uniref:hypothetical protein n=1 Tax=unclassified Paludibacterium TaxID=2618429 RepID=UPI001C05B949|nr:hypothetical protein [Paludibacterium sp. B53371]BEV70781.1 hypothetical protein THUN1379_02630 [Paludibacterium sp. THUN1379]